MPLTSHYSGSLEIFGEGIASSKRGRVVRPNVRRRLMLAYATIVVHISADGAVSLHERLDHKKSENLAGGPQVDQAGPTAPVWSGRAGEVHLLPPGLGHGKDRQPLRKENIQQNRDRQPYDCGRRLGRSGRHGISAGYVTQDTASPVLLAPVLLRARVLSWLAQSNSRPLRRMKHTSTSPQRRLQRMRGRVRRCCFLLLRLATWMWLQMLRRQACHLERLPTLLPLHTEVFRRTHIGLTVTRTAVQPSESRIAFVKVHRSARDVFEFEYSSCSTIQARIVQMCDYSGYYS